MALVLPPLSANMKCMWKGRGELLGVYCSVSFTTKGGQKAAKGCWDLSGGITGVAPRSVLHLLWCLARVE